jgi:hypothetical protein
MVHRRLIFNRLMVTRLLPAIGRAPLIHVLVPSGSTPYNAKSATAIVCATVARVRRVADRGKSVVVIAPRGRGQRPRLQYHFRLLCGVCVSRIFWAA